MADRLFGTDGVRGVAGELLSAELALRLGRAATWQTEVERPRVTVIRDTRESGEMLQAALASGVASTGADVLLGGVLPTPAAPLLIRRHGFDLAVVISASHNPFADNGIKFFGSDGFKLTDETEASIEARLDAERQPDGAGGASTFGHIRELRGAHEDYLRELHVRFGALDLDGLDVLLDCANGATFRVAPEIFRRPRREGERGRRCAGWAEHQRGVRLDTHSLTRRTGPRGWPHRRLCLRRRRGSRTPPSTAPARW